MLTMLLASGTIHWKQLHLSSKLLFVVTNLYCSGKLRKLSKFGSLGLWTMHKFTTRHLTFRVPARMAMLTMDLQP
jgi:hypothetical protein